MGFCSGSVTVIPNSFKHFALGLVFGFCRDQPTWGPVFPGTLGNRLGFCKDSARVLYEVNQSGVNGFLVYQGGSGTARKTLTNSLEALRRSMLEVFA